MYDIDFYMKFHELENYTFEDLEGIRNLKPVLYNIETTNACNMRCEMCPRTTMMTRPVTTMKPHIFEPLVAQLSPHAPELWKKWEDFVRDTYGITEEMSENHFFLKVISRVIQLHGYGDPLLDKNIGHYVKLLSNAGLETYFSCNPANINIERTLEMFEAGLTYIKYSIETTNDERHKEIRGERSNFSDSYANICKLLEYKKDTTIVITMIDLEPEQAEVEYPRLKEAFKGLDVYLYLKSQDNRWYSDGYKPSQSIHWLEPCKHPWMSMSVNAKGEAVMCMDDYDDDVILGDTKTQSLVEIWNDAPYARFRAAHVDGNFSRCADRCDMKLIGGSNV